MGQGLQGLSSAVGQLGSTAIQMAERDRLRAEKQAKIEVSNEIIGSALKLNDKLVSSGKTPFVVTRDVYRHIAKAEADAGLPTGMALGQYHQYFSAQTGVSDKGAGLSGKFIKDNFEKITLPGVGIEYINPANPEQRFTLKVSPDNLDAQAVADVQKSQQGDIVSKFQDRGIMLNYTAEDIVNMSKNPSEAPKEVKQIMEDTARVYALESKVDENELLFKDTSASNRQALLDNQTPTVLYNAAIGIIKSATENKDYTLDQSKVAMSKAINEIRSKVTPKVFDEVFGDLPEELNKMVVNAHPETAYEYDTKRYKTRLDAVQSEIGIMEAVYKRGAYGNNPALIGVKVATDMIRNVNPSTMTVIGTRQTVAKTNSMLADVLYTLGPNEFDRAVSQYDVSLDKSFRDLGKDVEDKDSFVLDLVSTAVQLTSEGTQSPMKTLELTRGLNILEGNREYRAKTIEEINRILEGLDTANKIDAAMSGRLIKFRTQIEGMN